jgi:hypothetical protein
MGLQDHFSLSEALTTAMTAATAQYYGGEVSSAVKALNNEATAAHAGTLVLASAKQAVALQVGNMIAGTSSHFDIKEVVTNMAQSLASIKAGSYSENPYASAAYATAAASAVDSVATHNVSIEALGAQMLGNEALAGVSVAAQKYLQPLAQRRQDALHDESTQDSTAHSSTYDLHQREVDEAFYNKMEEGLPGQLPDPSLDISPRAQALADNTNVRAGSWKAQTQQKSGITTLGTWKAMPKQSFTNAVANDLSNDAYHAYDAAKAFNSDKSGSTIRLLKAMETRAINAVSQEVQNTPKLIFDVARSITNPSSLFVNNYAEQGEQLGNSVTSLYNAYSNVDPATRSAMLARGVAMGIEGVGAAVLTKGLGFAGSALGEMSFIGSASRVGGGIIGEVGSVGGTLRQVSTGGLRNEMLLTEEQKTAILTYAKSLGVPEEAIVFSENMNTSYKYLFGQERLYIGTDVLPAINGLTANARVSMRGAIAHEVIGHRAGEISGMTNADQLYEEVQASIRAARYAPDLSSTERFTLLRDAIERLQNSGLKIKDVRNDLWINESNQPKNFMR